LALKELRFDEPCFGEYYYGKLKYDEVSNGQTAHNDLALAPTFSQAFRWFREKYVLLGFIEPANGYEDKSLFAFYICDDEQNIVDDSHSYSKDSSLHFNTYEEAELACLKKLIKISTQSKSENAELTPHIKYHDNGNVYIKGQKNSGGQEEGIWEWFFENGNIVQRIPFKEGKKDGIEEWFCANGNITKTRLWKDGKLIETTEPELTPHIEYYRNGNVWIKGQKNSKGQREGIWEIFWENGNIQWRIPYKEGKEDGIEEWFYENGNIHWRIPYKEDKIDGTQKFYDEQGNITETRLWKEGELIEITKH
jgi:antitoxin component YwqK of YwqJK toxin-antitoxin module